VYQKTRQERLDRGEEVPQLGAEELSQIYEVVGLGAVKYADLSQNRSTDYIFDWEKMLAMDGNTATYMQYVYARIRSIFRKGQVDPEDIQHELPRPSLAEAQERALAVQLLRLGEALAGAVDDYRPNAITAYLWDLSKCYNGFYHTCRVLDASSADLRRSRLLLCDLTARTLRCCLDLLGIRTVERM
jgi:arginyl-tRNA synthetase